MDPTRTQSNTVGDRTVRLQIPKLSNEVAFGSRKGAEIARPFAVLACADSRQARPAIIVSGEFNLSLQSGVVFKTRKNCFRV